MVADKSARLNAMTGANTSQPRKPKSEKVVHYRGNKPSGMTPEQFLELAPSKFYADIDEPQGIWRVKMTLYHKTASCLTYIAELRDLCETYIAPVYVFRRECGYQLRCMRRIYGIENQPPWQLISGAHFHREHGSVVIRNELDPYLHVFKIYFGFDLYQPIPTPSGGQP
jgi:hypothetical protein